MTAMALRLSLPMLLPVLAAVLLGSALAGEAPSAQQPAADGAGAAAPASLEHDTDVDKGARPNRRLFLVDLIRPPSPAQDPILTNEVDTSADSDLPRVLRVLIEDDTSDYQPRTADKPTDILEGWPSSELLPPPEHQQYSGVSWREPSRDLEPPVVQSDIDWSKVDFQSHSKLSDSKEINAESPKPKEKTTAPEVPLELVPPPEDSYVPEKHPSERTGSDDVGQPPSQASSSEYEKEHRDSYLPEAAELDSLPAGPVYDDFLAIGQPPKAAEPLSFASKKHAEEPKALPAEGQEATDYAPEPSDTKPGSDDFATFGVPPKKPVDERDYWTAPVKDDFVAIGVPPPEPEVPSSTQVPEDHVHEHVHDHAHVHEEGEEKPSDQPDTDDDASEDEVDGDGVKMTESKDFRKKRHICKMCGGYGGGYSMPSPISVTIVKEQPSYGGGSYCDVCGRPVSQPVQQPVIIHKPVYVKPVYRPQPQQHYQQPCNSCNQQVYQPPPQPQQPACNTCGGGGGGGGGYSQSYSQSSSSSSSSSYSGGWGKK